LFKDRMCAIFVIYFHLSSYYLFIFWELFQLCSAMWEAFQYIFFFFYCAKRQNMALADKNFWFLRTVFKVFGLNFLNTNILFFLKSRKAKHPFESSKNVINKEQIRKIKNIYQINHSPFIIINSYHINKCNKSQNTWH
jgi:hypothetical protein